MRPTFPLSKRFPTPASIRAAIAANQLSHSMRWNGWMLFCQETALSFANAKEVWWSMREDEREDYRARARAGAQISSTPPQEQTTPTLRQRVRELRSLWLAEHAPAGAASANLPSALAVPQFPEADRRPDNGWVRFKRGVLEELRAAGWDEVGGKVGEGRWMWRATREAGERWRALGVEGQEPYLEDARRELREWEERVGRENAQKARGM